MAVTGHLVERILDPVLMVIGGLNTGAPAWLQVNFTPKILVLPLSHDHIIVPSYENVSISLWGPEVSWQGHNATPVTFWSNRPPRGVMKQHLIPNRRSFCRTVPSHFQRCRGGLRHHTNGWRSWVMRGKDRALSESRFSGRTGYCGEQGSSSITFVLFLNFFL